MVEGASGVDLLPMGDATTWDPGRVDDLVAALRGLGRTVVVDAGVNAGPRDPDDPDRGLCGGGEVKAHLVAALICAGRSLLVCSSCYLALRRAIRVSETADGLVVVADPGRALNGRDISELLGVRLLAQIDRDPAVARSVDAGLFLRRPSRSIESALKSLVGAA